MSTNVLVDMVDISIDIAIDTRSTCQPSVDEWAVDRSVSSRGGISVKCR